MSLPLAELRSAGCMAATMRERCFRAQLLAQLEPSLPTGGTVMAIGCGPGTFAIMLARARPDATVIATDGDAQIPLLPAGRPAPMTSAGTTRPPTSRPGLPMSYA